MALRPQNIVSKLPGSTFLLPQAQSSSNKILSSRAVDSASKSMSEGKVGEVSKEETKTRSTVGQNCYLVAPDTDELLWKWNVIIQNKAREKGLDFYDTVFWVYERDHLLKAAARIGFPKNIPHWTFGQEFRDLRIGHQYRLQRIYEMVINADPAHAYLLKGNELVDQKLVMCHVMAHVDFFKNNIHFQYTNRDMVNRIADHAKYIEDILDAGIATSLEVEKFLDKAFSVKNLIDKASLKPREIKYELTQTKEPEPVPEDFGVIQYEAGENVPWYIRKLENDPKKIAEARKAEVEKRKTEIRKLPVLPDRDVPGFIIEHSTALNHWQRRVLGFIREQSYYFAPQGQTKIMNEGWASYWHDELMNDPDIIDERHISSYAEHNSGTLAKHPHNINPYALGKAIFKNIKRRWDKGQHGSEWEQLDNRKKRREYDTKEMKGTEKIFEVREMYRDIDFIQEFLTPEIAEEALLYTYDKSDESEGSAYVISGREFQEIKNRLLEQLAYGGSADIMVLDGNFKNQGELLLGHNFIFELKLDYALETTKNLLHLWGRPVHLDTTATIIEETKKNTTHIWGVAVNAPAETEVKRAPVRITAEYTTKITPTGTNPAVKVSMWKRNEHSIDTLGSVLHEEIEELKEDEN